MLALAGVPLGETFCFLDPSPDAPAAVAGDLIVAAYDDPAALDAIATQAHVVTYEFENVPSIAAERVAARVPLLPPPRALEVAQDRLNEKQTFERLAVPVPRYAPANDEQGVRAAVAAVGLPCVVKTRREGYDGKGQTVVRDEADVERVLPVAAPLIVEELVPFTRELSVIAARGRGGEVVTYPLVENRHSGGILRISTAPADVSSQVREGAEGYARAVLDDLDYVGVLTIELFEVDGHLVANEMAPRVHNSGHWTIEGAETSQFENHLRAILGLPLGSTAPRGHSVMLNLIGEAPEPSAALAIPGAHLHLYGKAPRPGRKLGHLTIRADDRSAVVEAARGTAHLARIRLEG